MSSITVQNRASDCDELKLFPAVSRDAVAETGVDVCRWTDGRQRQTKGFIMHTTPDRRPVTVRSTDSTQLTHRLSTFVTFLQTTAANGIVDSDLRTVGLSDPVGETHHVLSLSSANIELWDLTINNGRETAAAAAAHWIHNNNNDALWRVDCLSLSEWRTNVLCWRSHHPTHVHAPLASPAVHVTSTCSSPISHAAA